MTVDVRSTPAPPSPSALEVLHAAAHVERGSSIHCWLSRCVRSVLIIAPPLDHRSLGYDSPMRTPASIAGHPIHPMLVSVPIGCWIFSFACDLAFVLGSGASLWFTLGFWTMIGGVVGALAAAVPGVIDMLSLKGAPKKIALTHMALNITVVLLYAVNIGMRLEGTGVAGLPFAFSIAGVTLLAISGWLGGHMVFVHKVGVDEP